jgi:hypothetical protein
MFQRAAEETGSLRSQSGAFKTGAGAGVRLTPALPDIQRRDLDATKPPLAHA